MLDQILVIISVTFLVMVTPGPDMVLVLRNTLVAGRPAGLQTSIGILCGNLVHITYCMLHRAADLAQHSSVFVAEIRGGCVSRLSRSHEHSIGSQEPRDERGP